MKLRRLQAGDADFGATIDALTRYEAAQDAAVERTAREIIADVRARGDAALLETTARFDRLEVRAMAELEIGRDAFEAALAAIAPAEAQALHAAAQRIRRFHLEQRAASWQITDSDGTRLGQQVTPLERVGIYVPGGKAAYPSSVLMNAIPAKVAGVAEVVMVSPTPGGSATGRWARAAAWPMRRIAAAETPVFAATDSAPKLASRLRSSGE